MRTLYDFVCLRARARHVHVPGLVIRNTKMKDAEYRGSTRDRVQILAELLARMMPSGPCLLCLNGSITTPYLPEQRRRALDEDWITSYAPERDCLNCVVVASGQTSLLLRFCQSTRRRICLRGHSF